MKKLYLAIPYTGMENISVSTADNVAAKLMEQGYIVFSPVSHCHGISFKVSAANYFEPEFWMHQDLPWLEICDILCIIAIEGWKESKGLKRELEFALEHGKEIWFYDPYTMNILDETFDFEIDNK